jgi:undecaprenyl-diphosphatase
MTWLQAIILGIIQGLTEFLPISSSGHLVLTPYLLGWDLSETDTFVFNVLVQIPSLIAVVIYFWRDLMEIASAWLRGLAQRQPLAEPASRLGWLLIIATIPAGVIGLLLEDAVEAAFNNPVQTAFELWITAGLLVLAERVGRRNREVGQLKWLDAVWIGLAQAASIFPGISRSGSTITGGMVRNLERPAATRFAFLMSVPIMAAAGLLAGLDLAGRPNVASLLPVFLPGFIASGVVSYITIRWLLRYVARHSMLVFAAYCFGLGALAMLVTAVR